MQEISCTCYLRQHAGLKKPPVVHYFIYLFIILEHHVEPWYEPSSPTTQRSESLLNVWQLRSELTDDDDTSDSIPTGQYESNVSCYCRRDVYAQVPRVG